MPRIFVAFTPNEYTATKTEHVAVVADILRATSSMCAAFANGVKEIIPVGAEEELLQYHQQGYLTASERGGLPLPFSDFGNSYTEFTPERVAGKSIAYSTTNGTQALLKAQAHTNEIFIGCFSNLSALTNKLVQKQKDIYIICAGTKNRFSMEDVLFAGALCERLLQSEYTLYSDSALAATELWNLHKKDLLQFVKQLYHYKALQRLGFGETLHYYFTVDTLQNTPVYCVETQSIVNCS